MEDKEFYFTIAQAAIAEFKDRGSKFIAHAYPVETAADFKKLLQQLKKENPKAAHHCFAYRIGTDGNNFRASDDGEPSKLVGLRLQLGAGLARRQLKSLLDLAKRSVLFPDGRSGRGPAPRMSL